MARSLRDTILRNTSFIIAGQTTAMVASFLVVPITVSLLGTARYGIYTAFFAFVNWFSLLDFGFGAAGVKYTAEYYVKRDFTAMGRIITTSLAFYSLFLPVIFVPLFFSDAIFRFLNIPMASLDEARFVLSGMIIIFVVTYYCKVFSTVLVGMQRMDITSTTGIIASLVNAIGTVAVLKAGFGLKGMVILNGIVQAGQIIVQVVAIATLVPAVKKGIGGFRWELFRAFFSYGIKVQIAGVSSLASFTLDKLLISHFLRVDMVTFYELGSKMAMFIKTLPTMLLPPLMPASAELNALDDRARLKILYIRGSRYLIMASMPLAFFLAASAPVVMRAWMGSGSFEYSSLALRILAAGYFFNIITGVVTSVARGVGLPQYEMWASLFIAIINPLASTVLLITMGFTGALIGTAGSLIVGNGFYLWAFNRKMGETMRSLFIKVMYKPLAGAVAGSAAVLLVQSAVSGGLTGNGVALVNGRWENLALLGAEGLLFFILYFGILAVSKHIDAEDTAIVRRLYVWVTGRLPAGRGERA